MDEREFTFRRLAPGEDTFAEDMRMWQATGTEAIWLAAHQMVLDFLRMRGLDENLSRLDRPVISFHQVED